MLAVALLLFAVVAMVAAIAIFMVAKKKKAGVAHPPLPLRPSDRTGSVEPAGSAVTVVASLRGHGAIVFSSGPFEGRRYEISLAGLWIGRDETANLILSAASVSKKHSWIGVRNGRAVVIDEGSTNGTFVGSVAGERISEHILEDGETIVIADDVARFRYEKAD